MDWGTAAILAGVVTLEGFRRLPPGALVLRRAAWGVWSIAAAATERGRWTFVSWWPPLFASVVLPPAAPPAPFVDLSDLLRRARPWRVALDAFGLVTLVALVGGLPLATTRWGGGGFLGALAGVFALAVATAGVNAQARTRLALPRRPALAALSPFAAPQAGERLLEQLVVRAPRLAAMAALMPPGEFDRWVRPRAYDADVGRVADPELTKVLSPARRAEILAPPPRLPGAEHYCPRCGASYRRGDVCGNCEGIALVPFRS